MLKHARLSAEEESAAPAPAAEEKTGKEAAAGKTSAARSEKKAEAASEKKPFEKSHSKRKANGAISVVASARIQSGRYLWKGFRGRAIPLEILCRKWERLSSAVRLWMWKRERFEMRRPY